MFRPSSFETPQQLEPRKHGGHGRGHGNSVKIATHFLGQEHTCAVHSGVLLTKESPRDLRMPFRGFFRAVRASVVRPCSQLLAPSSHVHLTTALPELRRLLLHLRRIVPPVLGDL